MINCAVLFLYFIIILYYFFIFFSFFSFLFFYFFSFFFFPLFYSSFFSFFFSFSSFFLFFFFPFLILTTMRCGASPSLGQLLSLLQFVQLLQLVSLSFVVLQPINVLAHSNGSPVCTVTESSLINSMGLSNASSNTNDWNLSVPVAYTAGDVLTISLASTKHTRFRGLLLWVSTSTSSDVADISIGQFTLNSSDDNDDSDDDDGGDDGGGDFKRTSSQCLNSITHTNNRAKSGCSFYFNTSAVSGYEGDLVFHAAIVEDCDCSSCSKHCMHLHLNLSICLSICPIYLSLFLSLP